MTSFVLTVESPAPVSVTTGAPAPVSVTSGVGGYGPTGPAGPAGADGADGAAGAAGAAGADGADGGNYTHTESTPASTWNITHALAYQPNVTVVDDATGLVVETEVDYVNATNIQIRMTTAMSGWAYLS